jgi:hypothetical protein
MCPTANVGIKLGRDRNGGCCLLDAVRARANPGDVERLLLNIAEHDGKWVRIGFGSTDDITSRIIAAKALMLPMPS